MSHRPSRERARECVLDSGEMEKVQTDRVKVLTAPYNLLISKRSERQRVKKGFYKKGNINHIPVRIFLERTECELKRETLKEEGV